LRIKFYIQPNASKSSLIGMHGDAVKIKIHAPPVDGEANEEVIRFLSELLNLPKKSILIVQGQTSRQKLIEFLISPEKQNEIRKILGLNA
jgi:uncharacterized protein